MAVKKAAKKAAAKVRSAVTRSAADVRKVWEKLEPELAKLRRDAERKGNEMSTLTREEFEKKMKRVNSPMIVGHGWSSSSVPAGGSFNYTVSIFNPDPVAASRLAVTVFVGNRNAIASNDEFMTRYDERFGPWTQGGVTLAPGGSALLTFTITVPATVPKTGYFLNANLISVMFFDTGQYLDRACFLFTVT